MIRLAISVEGPTEEKFVKDVLTDHLGPRGVAPYPVLVHPGGGNVSIKQLASEMIRLRPNHDAVTSLVDFYGFRDKGDLSVEKLECRLIREIETRIPDARQVFPYVQKHEFEGLLFSDTAAFGVTGRAAEREIEALSNIRQKFKTPEDINDDPEDAPSKRIARAVRGYGKVLHGPMVAREAGLATIRAQCPRFDAWLTRMEGLARAA